MCRQRATSVAENVASAIFLLIVDGAHPNSSHFRRVMAALLILLSLSYPPRHNGGQTKRSQKQTANTGSPLRQT